MTEHGIICAGFGGQGILTMGEVLAYAGMLEGKYVSWLPSYGPEMRGGTSNCQVILSSQPIASPIVVEASAVVVMNLPSLFKFEQSVAQDGVLFINSSLVNEIPKKREMKAYFIPANEIAMSLGDDRVANMVMLGAVIKAVKVVSMEAVIESLPKIFGLKNEEFFRLDCLAMEKGAEYVLDK